MKGITLVVSLAGSLLLVSSSFVLAEVELGEREFVNNCAVCHGTGGKGNGPYSGMLQTALPDLTQLQKKNNGVFPFDRVVQTIDGRADLAAHGPRDMPIWGSEYSRRASAYYVDYFREQNIEGFVKARILALASYIYTLQEK